MKHDFSVSHSDLEGQSDGAARHNDNESAVSPQKSVRSAKSSITQDTYNNSKHSTTEDELRSLSTTPRYSHEDLGRLFSNYIVCFGVRLSTIFVGSGALEIL